MTLTPVDRISIHQLWQCHTNPNLFAQAVKWLSNFDSNIARWDWNMGFSHINGTKYPSFVYFRNDEDYLVFKLRWPELLKF